MELQLARHPASSHADEAACPVHPGAHAAQPPTAPTGVALFTEGDELYAAMLESIRGARRTVRMESYLFANDEIGWEFAEALVERAQAGVEVRLHLDAAGALGNGSAAMEQHLRERGVAVKWFHRWSWRRPLRYNRRNHRKLLVVDDQLAYVGGFNIHRESSRRFHGDARWRDTHASISGALVLDAARLFDVFWHGHRYWRPTPGGGANLIPNHTGKCRHRIRCLYSDAFVGARERIYLTTPYFVPDLLMQQRLMNAARRGVDVRLLVPSQSDVPLARWAAHAFYAALIAAGVRVYEYLPRMLHAKTIVIDGRWSVIGTANFDYRSLFPELRVGPCRARGRLLRAARAAIPCRPPTVVISRLRALGRAALVAALAGVCRLDGASVVMTAGRTRCTQRVDGTTHFGDSNAMTNQTMNLRNLVDQARSFGPVRVAVVDAAQTVVIETLREAHALELVSLNRTMKGRSAPGLHLAGGTA